MLVSWLSSVDLSMALDRLLSCDTWPLKASSRVSPAEVGEGKEKVYFVLLGTAFSWWDSGSNAEYLQCCGGHGICGMHFCTFISF